MDCVLGNPFRAEACFDKQYSLSTHVISVCISYELLHGTF